MPVHGDLLSGIHCADSGRACWLLLEYQRLVNRYMKMDSDFL